MTPTELLAAAQRLVDRADARTAGIWPRAAALLGRQALEQGLDGYWGKRGLKLANVATKPQLICLREYVSDADLAARVSHAWSSLTQACHHHPYELPPNHGELSGWLACVRDALAAMESA